MTILDKDYNPEEQRREEVTIVVEVEDEVQLIISPLKIQSPILQLTYRTASFVRILLHSLLRTTMVGL